MQEGNLISAAPYQLDNSHYALVAYNAKTSVLLPYKWLDTDEDNVKKLNQWMWDVSFFQYCCWRFKNSVICLLDGCVVPGVQEVCSDFIRRAQLCTRVTVLSTCTALLSNCLFLKPLQTFEISGTTHHMMQRHNTKDLSVHNSSVILNISVSYAMAHVLCHWPVTTEFSFRLVCVKFVWTK